MSSLYRDDFYVQDGIDIQTEQLLYWKKILNKKTYLSLLAEVAKQNKSDDLKTGYDVFRGMSLENFVMNLYERN
jgi:hypothetical protein